MSRPSVETIKAYLDETQARLIAEFSQQDPDLKVIEESWVREQGGGGKTCVLKGSVIEGGGVNVSHVHGDKLPASATAHRQELAGRSFQALGLSFIIHPHNPFVPTMHGNIRFFIAEKDGEEPVWWFGGGFDLTPYYGFVEDAKAWHQHSYNLCEPFGSDVYPRYKTWCDDYFYLKHRDETRGVGGLFFDDVNEWPYETCLDFWQTIGDGLITAYIPIMAKRKDTPYTEAQREFQLYRRGRYVEFNLLYDRGTLFGLQSNGRTESILVSMPPLVRWEYNYTPPSNSDEAKLYEIFLKPQDWLSM